MREPLSERLRPYGELSSQLRRIYDPNSFGDPDNDGNDSEDDGVPRHPPNPGYILPEMLEDFTPEVVPKHSESREYRKAIREWVESHDDALLASTVEKTKTPGIDSEGIDLTRRNVQSWLHVVGYWAASKLRFEKDNHRNPGFGDLRGLLYSYTVEMALLYLRTDALFKLIKDCALELKCALKEHDSLEHDRKIGYERDLLWSEDELKLFSEMLSEYKRNVSPGWNDLKTGLMYDALVFRRPREETFTSPRTYIRTLEDIINQIQVSWTTMKEWKSQYPYDALKVTHKSFLQGEGRPNGNIHWGTTGTSSCNLFEMWYIGDPETDTEDEDSQNGTENDNSHPDAVNEDSHSDGESEGSNSDAEGEDSNDEAESEGSNDEPGSEDSDIDAEEDSDIDAEEDSDIEAESEDSDIDAESEGSNNARGRRDSDNQCPLQ